VNLTVGIKSGEIDGLTTWREFVAMKMSSAHLFDSHTSLDLLAFNATLFVNISAGDLWTYAEAFIDTSMRNNVLNSQLLITTAAGVSANWTNS
jgi:hypothetical protein